MLRAPPEDVCGQYARTVHLWGPSRSPRVHRGPGADALASSQSFWLVWLPSHEELHRLGRRAVALPGPAWSGKSIHKVAERDSGSPLRTLPWCPVRGVAAQTQRATDRDPRSTPPRTGVSVRAGHRFKLTRQCIAPSCFIACPDNSEPLVPSSAPWRCAHVRGLTRRALDGHGLPCPGP